MKLGADGRTLVISDRLTADLPLWVVSTSINKSERTRCHNVAIGHQKGYTNWRNLSEFEQKNSIKN